MTPQHSQGAASSNSAMLLQSLRYFNAARQLCLSMQRMMQCSDLVAVTKDQSREDSSNHFPILQNAVCDCIMQDHQFQ